VTFDEDVNLGKARDTPPAPPSKVENKEDDFLEGPYVSESETDVVDDPLEPMDPLDPPPCDPPARQRPLWLRDTLKDIERHATAKGTFRESKKSCRYQGFLVAMSNIIQVEPHTFENVVNEHVWKDTMAQEYEFIMKNDVWEIVSRPEGKTVMTCKWLYKIKHGANGCIKKYKARFMARGFSQKEGEHYDEIFAPIARYTIIRSIVALATSQGWTIH